MNSRFSHLAVFLVAMYFATNASHADERQISQQARTQAEKEPIKAVIPGMLLPSRGKDLTPNLHGDIGVILVLPPIAKVRESLIAQNGKQVVASGFLDVGLGVLQKDGSRKTEYYFRPHSIRLKDGGRELLGLSSKDGKWLAVQGAGEAVTIVNVLTSKQQTIYEPMTIDPRSQIVWDSWVQFSPDGKYVAVGRGLGFTILALPSFKPPTFEKRPQQGLIEFFAEFSPNGKYCTTTYHRPKMNASIGFAVWDLVSGKQVFCEIEDDIESAPLEIQYLGDGKRILMRYRDGRLQLVDLSAL